MPKNALTIQYTLRALENASSIKRYLQQNFSDKEIDVFYSLLNTFSEAVSLFPELYPPANRKMKVRRAVLSRVLSVFYRISGDKIEVLAIIDNRCDLSEWL
jgi:plasmid stabilization system protein ParE